ncbi:F-box protein At5g07610-like [Aegilops tauschii subsp. strangulata]|uniref:F-box protein At5g07610-like n=1 Tax=Aegilops tauschii subsp. strangulata TaxID=200361 RepID=UPI003CC88501
MAKRSRKKKEQPAESLPDDLLLEVLARVPYRSLCRFKCVSKQWLALCSDPGLWKRSPQALSGFFCYARDDRKHELRFHNLSGRAQPLVDPGLPFLRGAWDGGVQTVDCCGGLLLCQCWKRSSRAGSAGMEYVVCNPATKEWTVVPATKQLHPNKKNIVRLGFDPLVPSRFAVFVLVRGHGVTRVEIFSSETGRWISKESEWGDGTSVDDHNCSASVFFGGALHLSTHDSSSQGRMYAMHMDYCNGKCQLSVWVLEDYASGQWTLKHTADMSGMIGHDELKRVAI